MRILRFRRSGAVLVASAALLAPGTASAANAEHVEWTADTDTNCTIGTSIGWTCTYDIWANNCPEVAVLGAPLAQCFLHVRAIVKIVPVLNAGRVVACTSGGGVVPQPLSRGNFNSTFPEFDNSAIDQLYVAQMYDAFADTKPGLLQFTIYEEGQSTTGSKSWLVDGQSTGTCARGASWVPGTGTGTVDVEV